jgi:hypothetical protein
VLNPPTQESVPASGVHQQAVILLIDFWFDDTDPAGFFWPGFIFC